MNKAIFLDRDGTINVDFGYVYKTQELELLPGVAEALRIFQELGYLLIVITNQSGIGRGYFTLEDAEQFNRALAQELEKHGVILKISILALTLRKNIANAVSLLLSW